MLLHDRPRRPQADTWERLVLKEWRTNVEAETGDEGTYSTRAFLGDFAATVAAGEKRRAPNSLLRAIGMSLTK